MQLPKYAWHTAKCIEKRKNYCVYYPQKRSAYTTSLIQA